MTWGLTVQEINVNYSIMRLEFPMNLIRQSAILLILYSNDIRVLSHAATAISV